MARFWIFTTALILAMLLLFTVFQAFDIPFLRDDASYFLAQKKWIAALAGFGLLAIDVIAPVPSSIIMTVNGTLFGVLLGAGLSLAGGMVASGLAYWIGARGEQSAERWMGKSALTRAHRFFVNHGIIAVVLSRPIPILAEAIGIVAGISQMPTRKYGVAAGLGLLPTAFVYSVAGSYSKNLNTGFYVITGVFALAGICWAIGKLADRSRPE